MPALALAEVGISKPLKESHALLTLLAPRKAKTLDIAGTEQPCSAAASKAVLMALTSSMRGSSVLLFGHEQRAGAGNRTFMVMMRQSSTAAL